MKVDKKGVFFCGCGRGAATRGKSHILGVGDCCREVVPREQAPRLVEKSPHCDWDDQWVVDGRNITGLTLTQQRTYWYSEELDLWSRPKNHESTNSLDGEW